jgi:hypothetical protein
MGSNWEMLATHKGETFVSFSASFKLQFMCDLSIAVCNLLCQIALHILPYSGYYSFPGVSTGFQYRC